MDKVELDAIKSSPVKNKKQKQNNKGKLSFLRSALDFIMLPLPAIS